MNEPHPPHPTTPLPAGWSPSDPQGRAPLDSPGPAQAEPSFEPPHKRRTGLIIGLCALALVLILVIGLIGGELFVRHRFISCTEKAFSEVTGASTDVSVSSRPLLWQWATGKTPYVQVDTKNADASEMQLHGRADNVAKSGDGFEVDSLNATGTLPFARVQQVVTDAAQQNANQGQNANQAQGGLPGIQISNITGDSAAGTVTVNASIPVTVLSLPVEVVVRPTVTDGKLTFQVEKADALVFGVPNEFAQTIVNAMTSSAFPPIFDKLHFDRMAVTNSGVDFAVSGSHVLFNKSTMGPTAQQQNSYSCGL